MKEFLENKDHESGLPEDYKFWTFHGTPGFLQLNMEGKWNGESFDDRRIECFDPYTGERLPQRYGFHLLAENPYEKINISVDESSYLLGYSKRKTFMNIHVPFLRNSLLFIAILISLEIIRELPITLILRPFNFETFATTAYISASEDLLEAAAVPSLFLILIAASFIIITSKYILRDNDK